MNVIIAGPIDAKGRYAGGIANIIQTLKEYYTDFEKKGITVSWFDTYRIKRNKNGNGRFNFENVLNTLILIKDLKCSTRNAKAESVYFNTSRGNALLKDLIVLSLCHLEAKVILHIHYAELKNLLPENVILKRLAINLLRTVPDKIVFLSKATCEEITALGIDKNKTTCIYNFQDSTYSFDDISKKIDAVETNESLRILFMGSLDERKGIVDLLKSLENIKIPYELNICGLSANDEIEKRMDIVISNLTGEIHKCGYVTGEEKKNIYYYSDILVLPSYGEGFPLVLLEAAASGCAIISTNVGAIPEVFGEKNGFIIEPGDICGLTSSLIALSQKEKLKDIMINNYELSKSYTVEAFITNICNTIIST